MTRAGKEPCGVGDLTDPRGRSVLDELYESDPVSHQLVNQAILVLERNGPAEGRRW
jgi:hypothetical protein